MPGPIAERNRSPQIREVLFLDTPDFMPYKNALILRRRFLYEDDVLAGDPEIVVNYRHPDLQKAAEMDVWPHIAGDYRIKFKAEALPFTRPSSAAVCPKSGTAETRI